VPLTGWEIGFRLTIERVWFALLQVIRITSISAVFLIIPYSMDPRLYGFSFRGLGLPDRFAYSMDLAFRYVPTLGRDFSDTLDAQKARGYEIERVEGGLITQVRRVAPLIVPVTMNSIVGGEDIANAMDLRCFGVRERTWISKTEMHWYRLRCGLAPGLDPQPLCLRVGQFLGPALDTSGVGRWHRR
jgi:energy-coupling factor transport system permease protein